MNESLTQISAKQLHAAARIKERIDELQAQLNSLLSVSSSQGVSTKAVTPGRRKMSAAGRARIAAAARARWAKIKGTAVSPATGKASSGRRKMSAAVKAKIAAAARLRWKKAKASGRNSL